MYRKSKYHISQASLEYFATRFNQSPVHKNLEWRVINTETYKDDGKFLDVDTGKTMGFDWEIRDNYFENGEFKYDTVGQYERKMTKPSIKISLQSDKDCYAIIVAWHEDFFKENIQKMNLATDTEVKQKDAEVRYTKHFKIYTINEIDKFKEMIYYAMSNDIYDAEYSAVFI